MKEIIRDNLWVCIFFRSGFVKILLVLVATTPLFAQTDNHTPTFGDSIHELVGFFAPFVFPKVVQDGYQLKEYVRSEEFASVRAQTGDVNAVDAIFSEAMRLSWNNEYEALFISFVATMDHNKFGVRLPIVGPVLWVPLTSEFEDEFRVRVNALPKELYDDSRTGGDRDKLQHFFGSAFLAYVFESGETSHRIGEFIEWGEDKVIVDGVLDERDFRANRQGQEFGLRLLDDSSSLPSKFLRLSVVQNKNQYTVPADSRSESLVPELEKK